MQDIMDDEARMAMAIDRWEAEGGSLRAPVHPARRVSASLHLHLQNRRRAWVRPGSASLASNPFQAWQASRMIH